MPQPGHPLPNPERVDTLSRARPSTARAGGAGQWLLVIGVIFVIGLSGVYPGGFLLVGLHHGGSHVGRSARFESDSERWGERAGSATRSTLSSSTPGGSSRDGSPCPSTVRGPLVGSSPADATGVVVANVPTNYSVVFTETGLPSGTRWWTNVTSNGTTFNSTTGSISFMEPNATYNYTVASANKSFASPSPSGKFTVNGMAVGVAITFDLVTYPVNFTETGLPSSTPWSVHINGTNSSSITDQILVFLPNGSYPYHINRVPGYRASRPNEYANVSGSSVNISVKFSVTKYAIEFTETGLANNTTWQVILTPTSGVPVAANSSTTFLKFFEPNGTYNYSFSSVSGYRVKGGSQTGNVTVTGTIPSNIAIHWTNTPLPKAPGRPILDYIIIGIVVAVVAFFVVLLLIRHRRKPRPVSPPAPWRAEEETHMPAPAFLEEERSPPSP